MCFNRASTPTNPPEYPAYNLLQLHREALYTATVLIMELFLAPSLFL